MPGKPSLHSVESQIARMTRDDPAGRVYTPSSFASLGSRASVDKSLQRLVEKKHLRRLARGLYDRPRHDPLMGDLWPKIDAVVAALKERDRIRIQPSGAHAANLLGLSLQVPARIVFLTDGRSRDVHVGPMRIKLKHTSARFMAANDRISGLIIQAFRSIGKDHIARLDLGRLRKKISPDDKAMLLADIVLAPAWMRPTIRDLASVEAPSSASGPSEVAV